MTQTGHACGCSPRFLCLIFVLLEMILSARKLRTGQTFHTKYTEEEVSPILGMAMAKQQEMGVND